MGSLQTFVKRKIPIRFGIVPMTTSAAAIDQAKIVYHLLDTYGLSAVFAYLEAVGCLSDLWFQLLTRNSLQLAREFRSPKRPISILPSRIEAFAETNMYPTLGLFLTRRSLNLEFMVQRSTSNDSERMKFPRHSSPMEWRCLEMRRGYRR